MASLPNNLEATNPGKEFASDGKGAAAGNPEPAPEKSSVEDVADAHGLGQRPGEEVGLKRKLQQRDEHRWELNSESAKH